MLADFDKVWCDLYILLDALSNYVNLMTLSRDLQGQIQGQTIKTALKLHFSRFFPSNRLVTLATDILK